MVHMITGKSLINDIYNYDAIILMMGINNYMQDGFLNDISVNFPSVKKKEIKSGYGDMRKYGNVYRIEDGTLVYYVCYVIKNNVVIEEYLEKCLEKIASLCKGKKISSILVGRKEIYEKYFNNNEIQVYLYNDITIGKKSRYYWENKELKRKLKEKEITRDEFVEKHNKLQWERLHGIYNKMPDGWNFVKKTGRPFRFNKKNV